MLGVAFSRKRKRLGCHAFEFFIFAIVGKPEQDAFLRKHLTEYRHRRRVVGITRNDDRGIKFITRSAPKNLGHDIYIGRFLLPDAHAERPDS